MEAKNYLHGEDEIGGRSKVGRKKQRSNTSVKVQAEMCYEVLAVAREQPHRSL